MAAAAITAVALNALFGLCVPGVSQGKLKQTLPSEVLTALTTEEKKRYADAIAGDDHAFRIRSDAGFILVTTKAGTCRVITDDGDTGVAATQFQQRLKAANGYAYNVEQNRDGYTKVDGMIPLGGGDAVVLIFTARKGGHDGFFASAFGVHKQK